MSGESTAKTIESFLAEDASETVYRVDVLDDPQTGLSAKRYESGGRTLLVIDERGGLFRFEDDGNNIRRVLF